MPVGGRLGWDNKLITAVRGGEVEKSFPDQSCEIATTVLRAILLSHCRDASFHCFANFFAMARGWFSGPLSHPWGEHGWWISASAVIFEAVAVIVKVL